MTVKLEEAVIPIEENWTKPALLHIMLDAET